MSHDTEKMNNEKASDNILENGFSLEQKILQMEKETNDLREKCEQSEKEKKQLQLQVDLLRAKNLQLFNHLKNKKEKKIQKLNELQRDLANKSKTQSRLRNQGEENDHFLVPKIETHADSRENGELIEKENRIIASDNCLPSHSRESESKNSKMKNVGFQFSRSSSTSLRNLNFSSGANYFMKSCRDVLEDPQVLDDIEVNDLKKMRRRINVPRDHISPVSSLPPTPLPSINKVGHDLLRKDLMIDSPVMTVPVRKSPSQPSKVSKNQELLNIGNSTVPNSSRRLTFCHQQSEGFDAPTEHTDQKFELDTGNTNHDDANRNSNANSSLMPFKFSAKRLHNGTVKLNFNLNNLVSMTVNPKNWEVSCILGVHDIKANNASSAVQPHVETANVQARESFTNNLASSEKSEPVISKVPKVEPSSTTEFTTPVLKSSGQSRFVSVEKSNTINHDHPHSSRALDAFANQHRSNVNHQHIENHADDNTCVVSSSCESPPPYRKKN